MANEGDAPATSGGLKRSGSFRLVDTRGDGKLSGLMVIDESKCTEGEDFVGDENDLRPMNLKFARTFSTKVMAVGEYIDDLGIAINSIGFCHATGGTLLDTTGNGTPDSVLVDADGTGSKDTVINLPHNKPGLGRMCTLSKTLCKMHDLKLNATATLKLHLAQTIAAKEHVVLYLPSKNEVNKTTSDLRALKKSANEADPEFMTVQFYKRRELLKQDPRIQAEISRWWNALSQGEFIDKNTYLACAEEAILFIDPTVTKAEMEKIAIEDWHGDVSDAAANGDKSKWRVGVEAEPEAVVANAMDKYKTQNTMDFVHFQDSMFELADVWCPDVDAEEYATFLSMMFEEIFASGKLATRLGNIQAMTRWRLLRHVMECPMVVKGLGAYDTDAAERRRAIESMAQEIMRTCDRKHKGKISACQMQAHLKGTQHKTFLNFMMRKNKKNFTQYDADGDEQYDMKELINAVTGYFDSDMYGKEVLKKKLHPASDKPAWKYSTPGADASSDFKHPAEEMQVEHEMHMKEYDEAHPDEKPMTRVTSNKQSSRPVSRAEMAKKQKSKCRPTLNVGWALKHQRWMQAKQISFAVKKLAGVKHHDEGFTFKESANVLTEEQKQQARTVFQTWDKNEDGGINKEELHTAILAVMEAVGQNAQVPGHEKVFLSLKQDQITDFVDNVFEKADFNGDQVLDEEEFVQIYNTIAINCINFDDDVIG